MPLYNQIYELKFGSLSQIWISLLVTLKWSFLPSFHHAINDDDLHFFLLSVSGPREPPEDDIRTVKGIVVNSRQILIRKYSSSNFIL